jgi:SAM-dependent methyltransferase
MNMWPLSVRTAFSKLKAEAFKGRMAGLHHLSVFPVPQLSPGSAASLRGVFQANGFDTTLSEVHPDENPALITLKRLFVHAHAVIAEEAARALSPLKLEELIHSGLLHQSGLLVQSLLQVQSFQGLFLFSDFFHNNQADDYVLPIGPSGRYLAGLTIRRPVGSVLDLGCGCGILSLLAARHCAQVTATDINPRALAMTRLNAELNGVSNIELLEGSFYEPVKGRRFDLILANLPYVITPENKLPYRDTVRPGDAYLHGLIRETPAYLTEGGFAQLQANWVHGKDEPWSQPLETTLEELGLDAWLIQNGSLEPEAYADLWVDSQLKKDPRKFAEVKNAWVKWYRDQGIERFSLGEIILRRRTSDQNWDCSASVRKNLETSAGEQIVRLFETQDYLAGLQENEALLEAALLPVDVDIQEDAGDLLAVSTQGLCFQAGIAPLTAEVIRQLDGRTSLRTAIRKTGCEWDDSDIQNFTLLSEIQILLGLGMLAPSSY